MDRLCSALGVLQALIQNLNELNADIIFIKNIDNVVPEPLSSNTIIYKKVIGGYLLMSRKQVFRYLTQLEDERKNNTVLLEEIVAFLLKKAFSIERYHIGLS